MLTRIDGKEQVRRAVVCAHPGAVEADSERGSDKSIYRPVKLLNHVDQRLSRTGLRRWLLATGCHIELDTIGTAGGFNYRRCRELVCGEHRRRKEDRCK